MHSDDKYLTGPQVQARYQITKMTLWRWLQDERLAFPQPTIIKRRQYFKQSEIESWERSRAGRAA